MIWPFAYVVTGLFVWFAMMILKYQRDIDILSDMVYKDREDTPRVRDVQPSTSFLVWVLGWGVLLLVFVVVCVGFAVGKGASFLFSWPEKVVRRWLAVKPEQGSEESAPAVHEIGSFRDGPIYVEDRIDDV